jgi:hypothetical protein
MYALIELEAWALFSSAGADRTKVEIKKLDSSKNWTRRLTKRTLSQQYVSVFQTGANSIVVIF